jgi:hypothetical protein
MHKILLLLLGKQMLPNFPTNLKIKICSLDSDDSSIDCAMNDLSEGKTSEDKQGRFLNLLKKWSVVLN